MLTHPSQTNLKSEVFDRPLHLAAILDQAADELARTWFGYEWNDRSRCNCGVVARQVMQVNTAKLKKLLPPVYQDGVVPCHLALDDGILPGERSHAKRGLRASSIGRTQEQRFRSP